MSKEIPPIGGRKGENHVDDIRPQGMCYSNSIEEHKKFCESLGNGTIQTDVETAKEEAQRIYTETRIAGRNGRGERP